MATKYMDFTGIAHWAKLNRPDEAFGDVRWCITVELDEPSMKAFKESGMGLSLKAIGDGMGVQFRRSTTKMIKGELVEFEPPKVTDNEGNLFDGLIGNGTKVKVNVAVYDAGERKGHRLQSVRVLDLVPYEAPDTEMPKEEVKQEPKDNGEDSPW